MREAGRTARIAVGLALGLLAPLGPAGSAAAVEGAGSGAAPASPWSLPPEGSCAPTGGLRGWPVGEDAPPVPFVPGDVIDFERAPMLESYLPPPLWEHRDKFFFEGMRLEIGPCFRDYGAPGFYRAATEKFAGRATVGEDGGLEGYTAGLPFPPEAIAADDPRAGLKWAWNAAHRYQGAGFRARFRLTDMVGRSHRGEHFEGEIFKAQLSFRADLADRDYTFPKVRGDHWVAGGVFTEPFAAREYAWRQIRDVGHLKKARQSDDLFAYLPQWRRVRRISSSGVEGLYLPSFSVGVVPATQISTVGGGGDLGAAGGAAAVGIGGAAAVGSISPVRSGFEGLEIRPLLYDYRVLGLQDVLAPLNAANPSWPADPDRGFGTWGLSFASDRWDLRRALLLEGRIKKRQGDREAARVLLWLDLQTLQPLYYVSYDRHDELIDVGQYVGRWSEDRADYPRWPDAPERPIRVIDPVGAAFANLQQDGGWRRETWECVSTPPEEKVLRRQLSVNQLTKRR